LQEESRRIWPCCAKLESNKKATRNQTCSSSVQDYRPSSKTEQPQAHEQDKARPNEQSRAKASGKEAEGKANSSGASSSSSSSSTGGGGGGGGGGGVAEAPGLLALVSQRKPLSMPHKLQQQPLRPSINRHTPLRKQQWHQRKQH